ncbi:recombinase family protein, partial [Vibrio cholerae]|nr:recombinase family protein [Vibrio cholerae]
MIFGYARVSTEEQNLHLQVDALTQFGVEKIYKEKLTGTRRDRP